MKRLSQEDIISRRERGLCFNCDEKYHRGHRCASRVFLLIAEEEDPSLSDIVRPDPLPDPPDNVDSIDPNPTQISFNSLADHLASEMLHLIGTIADHCVVVLVDGGSTHNFIQHQLVTQLQLPCCDTSPLRVMVGNGQHLTCTRVYEAIVLNMQSAQFTVDLHVLPISGANVVLGVQWLKALGPILTNYNTLCMQFFHGGRLVEFAGENKSTMNALTPSQFRRLSRTQGAGIYCHISILTDNPDPTESLPSPIRDLLAKFHFLFNQPDTLPPARDTDHHIHLLPQSTPVNVRPYRYPHFQKCEIELQVELMLQKGLIQPNTSPFSSPMLLVKKHDGTWWFCVDYRALNAITIRDRFPIPTIDELLDELGGVTCFSKLDLLQGYHQIHMHTADVPKTAFRTHHGHYEFRVMPFGLCNAPSSFQATMNKIFQPYLRQLVIVFFDDILIYSASFADHLLHLEMAFQVLSDNQFFLKLTKCFFAQSQVEYLGHLVSRKGVEPLASKIKAIRQWPTPCTMRAV